MATLAEVRERLRTTLEDTGVAPLWRDAELDEALRAELDAYSAAAPEERVAQVVATEGDRTLPLPVGLIAMLRVVNGRGAVIPERSSPLRGAAGEELAWELFGGELRFSQPLQAGTYELWHTAFRTWPGSDEAAFPVPEADLSLVLAGAVVWALDFRARQEWKRGPLPPRHSLAREAAVDHYRRLSDAWRRKVRVGAVRVT